MWSEGFERDQGEFLSRWGFKEVRACLWLASKEGIWTSLFNVAVKAFLLSSRELLSSIHFSYNGLKPQVPPLEDTTSYLTRFLQPRLLCNHGGSTPKTTFPFGTRKISAVLMTLVKNSHVLSSLQSAIFNCSSRLHHPFRHLDSLDSRYFWIPVHISNTAKEKVTGNQKSKNEECGQ